DEFMYPRLGAGQLYEKMQRMIVGAGGEIRTRSEVTRVRHSGFRVVSVDYRGKGEPPTSLTGDFYLSSAPLTELVTQLDPPAPPEVLAAAESLRYRNHICVNLIVEGAAPFADNW